MTNRKYWRLYCQTDGYVYEWSVTVPTVCPINPAHTILDVVILNENKSSSALVGVVVSKSEDDNYTSIAEAFSDGNTDIFVKNGTYVETSDIIIPDRGKLIGETPGSVIVYLAAGNTIRIDGSGGVKETSGTIAMTYGSKTIIGTGTTFTNLSVEDFILIGNNYCQIETIANDTSLNILNIYHGSTQTNHTYVAQTMVTGIVLQNLVITGSSSVGLTCRAARLSHIHGVGISKNALNMHILDSGDCSFNTLVSLNSITTAGARIQNCVDLIFDSCNIYNNNGPGIEIMEASNHINFDTCTVSCNNGSGYDIDGNSHNITITDGNIKQNYLHGVHCKSTVENVLINSCLIVSNSKGINMEGNYCVASCCTVIHNNTGIESSGFNSITGCIIGNSGNNGIDISSNNGLVTGNHVRTSGGVGIYVTGDDNNISINRVNNNTGNGVELTATAENNIITSNNFKGNTGTNFLDNGTGTITSNNISA